MKKYKFLTICILFLSFNLNPITIFASGQIPPLKSVHTNSYKIDQSYKLLTFKTEKGKGSYIEITTPSISKNNMASVTLTDSNNEVISTTENITSKSKKAAFFVNRSGTYYLWAYCKKGTITLNIETTSIPKAAGNSFANARIIEKSKSLKDTIGVDIKKAHYYKLKVPKQKLTKLTFTKKESTCGFDVMSINVYKSSNKKTPVASGKLFSGQNKAYLYIRNSSNYDTLPGTYYIKIDSAYNQSSFSYTVSW